MENKCNFLRWLDGHVLLRLVSDISWIVTVSDVHCKAQYHCASGECIDGKLLCDGEWNCDDGSDELNCRLSGTYLLLLLLVFVSPA